jgi:hypothetical protein
MMIVATDRESPEGALTDRTAEEVPEGRLCTFCGWDRVQYDPECPHLVTDLTEWPENFSGAYGGTFGKVEVSALGPLYRAVRDFLRSGRGSTPPGWPDRLRTLIQAVARHDEDSDEEDTELDTEVDEFGPERSPNKDAFQEYVLAVFRATGRRVQATSYDSEDVYGTCPTVLWSPDAGRAAGKMVTLIGQDVGRLRREKGRKSGHGRPGSGRRGGTRGELIQTADPRNNTPPGG